MTKPTTIEQVFGRYFGITKDQAGHYWADDWTYDVTDEVTEAVATIEQLVLETKPKKATGENSPGYDDGEISAYNHGIGKYEQALKQLVIALDDAGVKL